MIKEEKGKGKKVKNREGIKVKYGRKQLFCRRYNEIKKE